MKKEQFFGFGGAIMLIIGAFLPLVNLPFVGAMNYFHNGEGDGVLIVIFGVATLIITLTNNCKYNIAPGLFAIGMLIFTYFTFQSRLESMKSEMGNKDLGMFQGVADMAVQSISIEYGFAIIALGGIFAIISGFSTEKS